MLSDAARATCWAESMRDGIPWPITKGSLRARIDALDDWMETAGPKETPPSKLTEDLGASADGLVALLRAARTPPVVVAPEPDETVTLRADVEALKARCAVLEAVALPARAAERP